MELRERLQRPWDSDRRTHLGRFRGRYHVRYFLETGEFSDEYDLAIEKHPGGDFYDVTWISDGTVSAKGVGMEVGNGAGLAVGWRRVAD